MPPPFDVDAFEAGIKAKVKQSPHLARVHNMAGLAMITFAVVGVLLLASRVKRRAEVAPPPGPPETPRWAVVEVGLLLIGTIPIAVTVLFGTKALGYEGDLVRGEIVPSALISLLLCILAYAIVRARGQGLRALGFAPGPHGTLGAAAIGVRFFLMGFPIYYGVNEMTGLLQQWAGVPRSMNPAAVAVLTTDSTAQLAAMIGFALVIAPLTEELILRGFMYPAFRARFGRVLATVLTATLFAVLHPTTDMPAIFCLGVALTLAYERAGSLYGPLTTHAVFNAWGVVLILVNRYIHRAVV